MPGTATGTQFLKSRIVAAATASGDAVSASSPGTIMFGFSTMPSSQTRWA